MLVGFGKFEHPVGVNEFVAVVGVHAVERVLQVIVIGDARGPNHQHKIRSQVRRLGRAGGEELPLPGETLRDLLAQLKNSERTGQLPDHLTARHGAPELNRLAASFNAVVDAERLSRAELETAREVPDEMPDPAKHVMD